MYAAPVAVLVAVDDDQVLVEHRRASRSRVWSGTRRAISPRPCCPRSRSRRRASAAREESDLDALAVGRRGGTGVAVLVLLLQVRDDRRPSPRGSCRSRIEAVQHALFSASMHLATKTLPRLTIGDEWPVPGSAVFHCTFSVADQVSGKPVSTRCRRPAGRASRASPPRRQSGNASEEDEGCNQRSGRHSEYSQALEVVESGGKPGGTSDSKHRTQWLVGNGKTCRRVQSVSALPSLCLLTYHRPLTGARHDPGPFRQGTCRGGSLQRDVYSSVSRWISSRPNARRRRENTPRTFARGRARRPRSRRSRTRQPGSDPEVARRARAAGHLQGARGQGRRQCAPPRRSVSGSAMSRSRKPFPCSCECSRTRRRTKWRGSAGEGPRLHGPDAKAAVPTLNAIAKNDKKSNLG